MNWLARCGWALALTSAVFAIGCRAASPAQPADAQSEKPVVVVSVPPQAFFVEQIAGDLVDVEVMIPPGANPTTYEPSIKQIQALERAALYVQVGHPNFPFEATWLSQLAEDRPQMAIVNGSEGIEQLDGDPHVWLSPDGARSMCQRIERALVALLPDARDELDDNLVRLMQQIDELDLEISKLMQEHAGKRFLVYHPAWGYFARDYGLEQISIEHDHKEPGLHDVSELIALAEKTGLDVVFVQPQFSQQSAHLIAERLGGEVVPIDPLARDWLNSMRSTAYALSEGLK